MSFEICPGMAYAEYAARNGINATLLKLVRKSCLLNAKAYLDGELEMESDDMDFGTAYHSLTLEGIEAWATKPETYPAPADHPKVKGSKKTPPTMMEGDPLPWNGNAKACKEWEEEQGDSLILSTKQAQAVRAMAEKTRDELGSLLNGSVELSLFTSFDGVPVKSRLDLVPNDPNAPLIDLKKTKNAEPRAFLRQCIDLGYHQQAAFCLDVAAYCGIQRAEFWLYGIEPVFPHATVIIKFADRPGSLLRLGRKHNAEAMAKLATAAASGEWLGYGTWDAEQFAPAYLNLSANEPETAF